MNSATSIWNDWIDSIPTGAAVIDVDGQIIAVNQEFCDLNNSSRETLINTSFMEILPVEMRFSAMNHHDEFLSGRELPEQNWTLPTADGKNQQVMARSRLHINHDGIRHRILTLIDITHFHLREVEKKLTSTFFDHTSEGCIITDANRNILHVNPAFCRLTGYSREELIGSNPRILQSEWHDQSFYEKMWKELAANDVWKGEIWDRRKNGELYVEWLIVRTIRDAKDKITHYIGFAEDITESKTKEDRINHLAYYDPLTDLPNRNLLLKNLTKRIESDEGKEAAVIFFCDLDRFKAVNESYGHRIGDSVLLKITTRLIETFWNSATIARVGGDEFAFLFHELKESEIAEQAREIQRVISQPVDVNGVFHTFNTSVGVALFGQDGDEAEELLKNAETAMYQTKNSDNSICWYDDSLNSASRERFHLEARMRRALTNREFVLYLQPQVNIKSGRMIGAEVLIRWIDPEKGMVSPADFIPLSEDTGLIIPIGEWVLNTACGILKHWQNDPLFTSLKLAVNLSARQFQDSNLVAKISHSIQNSEINPARLELEITESAAMHKEEKTIETLKIIKELGGGLAMDDFGTGYSSLSYLKKFPIDKLKIDQAFVRELSTDTDDAAIVRTIIDMARALGLRVIAEGAETREQVDYLQEHGCDEIQGYFFAKPMPIAEFEDFVRNFNFSAYFPRKSKKMQN